MSFRQEPTPKAARSSSWTWRPGKDRHPCPKPDQAFRLHTGCRHQSYLHWSPPGRKALRRKTDGRGRHGENSKRPHPHRQTHRNGRTGILQTAGSLAAYGYANSEKIRDIVAAIVPTYHSADSDLKLHKKVYEELMSEAAVSAEKTDN